MYKNKSDLSQPGRFYLIWQCLERLAEVQNIDILQQSPLQSQYEIVSI